MLSYQFPCKLLIKQVFYNLSGGREEGKPKTLQHFIKGVSLMHCQNPNTLQHL